MTQPGVLADQIRRALFLREQTLLRRLPAGAIFALERSTRETTVAPGETIDVGTDAQRTFVAVVEGELEATRPERPPWRIPAGNLVGLTHLLAYRPPLRVRAVEASSVLQISDEELEDLIERHFGTVGVLVRYLALECLADLAVLPDGVELGPSDDRPPIESLDFAERLAILAGSDSLPSPSLDALAELARHAETRRWNAGDTLWTGGDVADGFFFVVEGAVECDTGSGRHLHRGVGTTVGEYEALAYAPRGFTAVVARRLVGLYVDRDLFFDVLEDHAGMARGFLGVLARRRLELAALRHVGEARS